MIFSDATKVKEIALSDLGARRILEDAGVDYCCGGGKSLQEACLHANVSSEEILERLRRNKEQTIPDEANWISASLCELTLHIREKHHRYVREAISRVRPLLQRVRAKHGENHPVLLEIEILFSQVGQEMVAHMQKEEQILFPYIDALERSANRGVRVEPPFFQTVRNPIHTMMKEHDTAGDLVKQIRKASSAYSVPADACASFRALYTELSEFEADLHQHVHLENNILFPRAVELEAAAV